MAAELLVGSGDGVWLVELASVSDQDAVASTIAQTLGIASQPDRPVLEVLLDALVTQDILIVLDNCEHLITSCAKVADAILRRCQRVHLLATSREPLGISGERIYRVPSLSLPPAEEDDAGALQRSDAVALFVERAIARSRCRARQGETAPLVVSICRRLDGMPLAIELAAARLRSLSLSSVHDLSDQRFRLLTGGSRSAGVSHKPLQPRASTDSLRAHRPGCHFSTTPVPVEPRSGDSSEVQGRLEDLFDYGSGIQAQPHIFRSPFGREPSVIEYQVRQTPRGADITPQTEAPIDAGPIRQDISRALSRLGLMNPIITLSRVAALDRTDTGKLRRFIPLPPTDTRGPRLAWLAFGL